MKVKLLSKTPDMLDVIYTAARTCYNAGSPIDMWENIIYTPEEKKLKLVKGVIKSGHCSTVEHTSVVFAVGGVSRALLAQISRHRFIQLSVQSQRYVEIKEKFAKVKSLVIQIDPFSKYYCEDEAKRDELETELRNILTKYFVITEDTLLSLGHSLLYYLNKVGQGMKPEDARAVLPNATKTNMIVSMNLRELMHVCGLRLCTNAQKEIRNLIKEMRDLVVEQEPWLDEFLQPKCIQAGGICNERNTCGMKPCLKDVMNIYKGYN